MPSWLTRGSWSLWQESCQRDVRRFERALRNPAAAQEAHLRSILSQADRTAWAARFGIHARSTLKEFRERVPVQDPGELGQWTDRIVNGERNVLTKDAVERLVPTSGTTGNSKLIPMTPQSRREFSTGINLWLSDCMRKRPEIKAGRCYIATSPAIDFPGRISAVPVGFAHDGSYVSRIQKFMLGQILAVPGSVANLRGSVWRDATRRHLMETRDLRFLSLWHPGYLEALFTEEELSALAKRWTGLGLVSTWADGACAEPARKLMKLFPQATHIPKGLWLTEGVVSIPWQSAHPVALLSSFFEFERHDGRLLLAGELELGMTGRPVLTNHAGLYRYRLGDLVKVTGFIHNTPSLRWMGRADQIADLCGEKLSEAQVAGALEAVGWTDFAVLLPAASAIRPHYICLAARHDRSPFPIDRFERMLQENPHYAWAQQVGQLASLRLCAVDPWEISQIRAHLGHSSDLHKKASFLLSLDQARELVPFLRGRGSS